MLTITKLVPDHAYVTMKISIIFSLPSRVYYADSKRIPNASINAPLWALRDITVLNARPQNMTF